MATDLLCNECGVRELIPGENCEMIKYANYSRPDGDDHWVKNHFLRARYPHARCSKKSRRV